MPDPIDFIGRYDHTLDSKNRLMVPQAFRDIVKQSEKSVKFYLNLGFEKCVSMYTPGTWREMVALLKTRKADELSQKKMRKFLRLFYSRTVSLTPDKAGRIVIPERLKVDAGLQRKVVLIGVSDRIEIWDAERWSHFSEGEEGEYEQSVSEIFRGV